MDELFSNFAVVMKCCYFIEILLIFLKTFNFFQFQRLKYNTLTDLRCVTFGWVI